MHWPLAGMRPRPFFSNPEKRWRRHLGRNEVAQPGTANFARNCGGTSPLFSFMKSLLPLLCSVLLLAATPSRMMAAGLAVRDVVTASSDFPLAANGRATTILVDGAEPEVVRIAAGLLAEDV